MTNTPRPKPPTQKTLWELPGVLKVGLVSEEQSPQATARQAQGGAVLPVALAALAVLCVMFLMLGRRKRRTTGKP